MLMFNRCSDRYRIFTAVIFLFTAAFGAGAAAPIAIHNLNDLRKIGADEKTHPLNGVYELKDNINAAGVNFAPIGSFNKPFSGNFNGGGFTISNLYIDRPSNGHVGLFARVTGAVRNLGVVSADVTGSFAVGVIAGTNDGTITNSYSSGTVTGLRQETNAGGLTGVNGGAIEKSYSAAAVNGRDNAGGLTGMLTITNTGRIEESYATGSVTGSSAVGGLAGYALGGSIIKSFSMGTVTAKNGKSGGLIGVEFRSANPNYNSAGQVGGAIVGPVQIINSFWDINTSGMQVSPGGGDGKTTREMLSRSTFQNAGWDFGSGGGWDIKEGAFYPQLKSAPDFTLTYKSGPNGRLGMAGTSGTSASYELTLNAAITGTEITAVPDPGYRFVNWSDGITEPARSDGANKNINVTAVFAQVTVILPPGGDGNGSGNGNGNGNNGGAVSTYTLTYEAIGSGRIIIDDDETAAGSIKTVTDVEQGRPGPKVTAVANEGFHFIRWSDNVTDAVRKDIAERNLYVFARFGVGTGAETDPTAQECAFAYATDGGGTLKIASGAVVSTMPSYSITMLCGEQTTFSVTAMPNAGYAFLKWSDGIITPTRTGDRLLKDITAVTAEFVELHKLTYIAEAGGKVRLSADPAGSGKTTLEQWAAKGTQGQEVIAEPENSDYSFIGWSDGHGQPQRTDLANANKIVTARFLSAYNVTYRVITVDENGAQTTGENVGGLIINDAGAPVYSHEMKILPGDAGLFVEAVVREGTVGRYKFLGWDDGYALQRRIDVPNEASQKVLTAVFREWDYIPIGNLTDLAKIGVDFPLNGKYELVNDIDASISKNSGYNGGAGFLPIGVPGSADALAFRGELIGNGFTIKNLYINRPSSDNVGLFGYTHGSAKITGVLLEDVEIIGRTNVGALVGCAMGSTVVEGSGLKSGMVKGNSNTGGLIGLLEASASIFKNNYSAGDVENNSGSTGNNFGGLVGHTIGRIIENCYFTGTVTVIGNSVGGLIGALGGYTRVINCYSTGTVNGAANVGGLVGYAYTNGSSGGAPQVLFERCHSTGTVNGTSGSIGGLVGQSFVSGSDQTVGFRLCYSIANVNGRGDNIGGLLGNGNRTGGTAYVTRSYITDSYAAGKVTTAGSGQNVGGLAGRMGSFGFDITNSYAIGEVNVANYTNVGGLVGSSSGSVSYSYSTGKVVGGNSTGGFIGSLGSAAYCYYDIESSGMEFGRPGSSHESIFGVSTEEMRLAATFVGWTFGIGWAIDEGSGYPYLQELGPTKHPTPPPTPDLSKRLQTATITPRAIIHGKTLVITASPDANLQIRFYDLRGRTAARYTSSGSARISINRVPAGKYLLEVRENGKRMSVSPVVLR